MTLIEAGAIDPPRWIVVFGRSNISWINRLVPGRYKHVRAYAYLPGLKAWLFYEVHLYRTAIVVAPDNRDTLARIMWPFVKDCDLVSVPRQECERMRLPILGWCVPAIRHLLGVPGGALLPDALYRDCLAAGGQPLGCSAIPGTAA